MLISAGFDAHSNDPITSLGLSSEGFFMVSSKLVELAEDFCNGMIVFVLEGGYNPQNLADGAAAVFASLLHKSFTAPRDGSNDKEPDIEARIDEIRKWHAF